MLTSGGLRNGFATSMIGHRFGLTGIERFAPNGVSGLALVATD